MKKMILLAVVAALALAGQAATVDWKINYAGQGSAWKSNGAFALVFNGADYDDVVKLITVTGSDTLQADLAAKALNGSAATFGSTKNAATTMGSVADAPGTMFIVIFNEASYDAGKSVLYTDVTDVSGSFYEPPATGTAFTFKADSFTNSGTIASVPEPTSGLLMLVGLAGLALRRRRA